MNPCPWCADIKTGSEFASKKVVENHIRLSLMTVCVPVCAGLTPASE